MAAECKVQAWYAGKQASNVRVDAITDLAVAQSRWEALEAPKSPYSAEELALLKPKEPGGVKGAVGAERLKRASAARASELSDYIPEAIPPVALPDGFRVVIDAALASQEIVYFAAGDPAVVLKLRGEDLGRATDAVVAELA